MKNDYCDSQEIIDSLFGKDIQFETRLEKRILNGFLKISNNSQITDLDKVMPSNEILQIVKCDKPDLLLVHHNNVLAIEHFRVDASLNTKNGSLYMKKYNKKYFGNVETEIDKRLSIDQSIIRTEKVETKLSYNNLFDNMSYVLKDHYNKIPSYIDRIRKIKNLEKVNINIVFFIELQIVFPSFTFKQDGNIQYLFPCNDIRFFEILKKMKKLLGVIIHYDCTSPNLPYLNKLIITDIHNLNHYKKNNKTVFDFSQIEIHDFENPMMSSYAFIIKNGDI